MRNWMKELKEGQDMVAATVARRARQEPRYVFKKKSHEEQSKVNENVDDAMREAEVELQSEGSSATIPSASNIKSALESLKKGRAVIAERQKLIKIADRSELGWAVMNEYTADELAENSNDEKRMEKAAERKAACKRKAPAEKSKASKRSGSAMVPVQTFQPHPSAQFQLPFVRRAPAQQSTPKMPGPCFTCGQMGHLKNYCPKTQASSSKTVWYPPPKVHSDTGFVCSTESEHVDNVCTCSSEKAGMPAVDESEAPSEVHSEGESYVLSPCDQAFGAAACWGKWVKSPTWYTCTRDTWGNGRCAW